MFDRDIYRRGLRYEAAHLTTPMRTSDALGEIAITIKRAARTKGKEQRDLLRRAERLKQKFIHIGCKECSHGQNVGFGGRVIDCVCKESRAEHLAKIEAIDSP